MKKFTALLLALVLILGLVACGGSDTQDTGGAAGGSAADGSGGSGAAPDSSGSDTPADTGNDEAEDPYRTLRIGTTAEVAGNMAPYSGSFSYSALPNVYDSLFDRDGTGLTPRICSEYYWEDTTHLVLVLRDNVYFASGNQLTGEDVLYSIRMLNDEPTSGMQTYFGVIDFENSFVSEDGMKVTLAFGSEYGPFTSRMDQIYIVEKAVVESWTIDDPRWWDQPSGSGPYELVENIDGSHATFRLRDDYWNDEVELYWDEVVLEYYTDQTVLGIAFQNGEVDVIAGVSASDAARILNGEVENGALFTLGSGYSVILNYSPYTPELEDLNVRKALTHAIDFNAVAVAAYGDMWKPVDSALTPETDYYVSVGAYEYDVEYAKECLAASAYPDGFELNAVIINSTEKLAMYEAIQAYWSEIGVTLNFEAYVPPVALPMVEQEDGSALFDMGLNGTNLSREPHSSLSAFYENGTFAPCRVLDATYNEWYNKAIYTNDPAQRAEAYEFMQNWYYENYQCIPMFEALIGIGYRTDKISADSHYPGGNTKIDFSKILPVDAG